MRPYNLIGLGIYREQLQDYKKWIRISDTGVVELSDRVPNLLVEALWGIKLVEDWYFTKNVSDPEEATFINDSEIEGACVRAGEYDVMQFKEYCARVQWLLDEKHWVNYISLKQ